RVPGGPGVLGDGRRRPGGGGLGWRGVRGGAVAGGPGERLVSGAGGRGDEGEPGQCREERDDDPAEDVAAPGLRTGWGGELGHGVVEPSGCAARGGPVRRDVPAAPVRGRPRTGPARGRCGTP